MEARHDSVLMKEVLETLEVKPSDTVLDATLGGAGHFKELLAALGADGTLVGIDADPSAVVRARETYALDRRFERPVTYIVNNNFRNLSRILERLNIASVDVILFDLGWSGYQIAAPRGFSFSAEEAPLLMTYGLPSQTGETAADLVNKEPEDVLAGIIATYGEERFARPIARSIVEARSKGHILTTTALVEAIKAGTPEWYHRGRTHPATKTFQAIRIAVNDEIGALKEGLTSALRCLAPQGRLAVISFHSIEDRAVKNILKDAVENGLGTLVHKKPLVPTRAEIATNRRARSAKLRVFKRSATSIGTAYADPISSYVA